MTTKMYGFRSAKQTAHTGELVYQTPDGREVLVTEISSSPNRIADGGWDDFEAVGEVTTFVRRHSWPTELSAYRSEQWPTTAATSKKL